jgi:hypothetical protein
LPVFKTGAFNRSATHPSCAATPSERRHRSYDHDAVYVPGTPVSVNLDEMRARLCRKGCLHSSRIALRFSKSWMTFRVRRGLLGLRGGHVGNGEFGLPLPHRFRVSVAAFILGLSGACTGGNMDLPATSRASSGVSQPEFQPVTDIPIPTDASMDTERSLILSSRDQWTGRVVMKLGDSPSKAFAFYQREMPAFRWVPVMSVQSEISVLTFTREGRAATVQVQGRTVGGSMVIVTIAPRQAGESTAVQAVPLSQ